MYYLAIGKLEGKNLNITKNHRLAVIIFVL